MRIRRHLASLKWCRHPVSLAVGFFDGVHRGHREVLRRAQRAAARSGGECWVLTFGAHPMKILQPDRAPALLTSSVHKLRILEALGIDGCIVLTFSKCLANLSAPAFVERLARSAPTLRRIYVGRNWRFGREGRGTPGSLRDNARRFDIAVSTVTPVLWRNRPVSSTRIRCALCAGSLAEANAMLGRPFAVLGNVVRGKGLGRAIGFRTANLAVENEVWPAPGIYAVRAQVQGTTTPGVVNIGTCPTILGASARTVSMELHLIEFNANLYGTSIEVEFVRRLRDEKRFRTVQALRRQIQKDVQAARRILADGGS